MQAKTIDNSPFGWNAVVYDNEDSPMIFALNGLFNKYDAVDITESFNLELSSHISQETAPLLAEIDRLKKEVKKFEKENDRLRVAYKSLERKLNVASESLKEANEFLNDPKKLGEYIAGM